MSCISVSTSDFLYVKQCVPVACSVCTAHEYKYRFMKKTLFILFTLIFASGYAQQVRRIPLNPAADRDGASEMYVYLPEKKAGTLSPAVVICPGGAYSGLAIGYEGHDAARWFASQGVAAAVLKYRMPHGLKHTLPLEDAVSAITTVRDSASVWDIDVSRVGAAGFSAGGHLAASLCTLTDIGLRPDFAVLFYPVVTFTDSRMADGETRDNLIGKCQDKAVLAQRYSLEKHVEPGTPPTLIMLSGDDSMVDTDNSIVYYRALKSAGVPSAMYIFPTGEHGWGFLPGFAYHNLMKELILQWMQGQGIIEKR